MTRYKLRPVDSKSKERLLAEGSIKSVAPLDCFLGIDKLPFKMSFRMMLECAYWAQNQVSYDKAENRISDIRGQFVNDDTIRLVTNYIGRSVFDEDCRKANEIWGKFNQSPFAQAEKPKIPTMYLEIDGSAVNTRIKNDDGSTWRENKLAIIFNSNNVVTRKSKNGEIYRRILKREYISFIGSAVDFKKHVLRGAVSNGYPDVGRLVILSDGAEWIYKITDELFGLDSSNVIHILDYFHLSENVYDYARAKFNNVEEKYIPWAKRINEMLKDGKWQDVLTELDENEKYKNTVNLYHYISSHSNNINYPEYIKMGLFIGSGAIESANKKIVQARLKQAGMRWSIDAAQNMVTLISKVESGLWERDVVQHIRKILGNPLIQ